MYEETIYQTWMRRKAQQEATTPAPPPPTPMVQEKLMPTELDPTLSLDQAQNIAQEAQPAAEIKEEELEKPAAGASREEQVKQSIGELSTYINEVAKAVYQMQLTQNQSQEITTKIVTMISDYISNITVERVKNIAEQFMKVEAKKRIAKALNLEYRKTEADWKNTTVLSQEDVKYINELSPYVKALAWPLAGIAKSEGATAVKEKIFASYQQLKNKIGAREMEDSPILRQYREMVQRIFGVILP
jgi:hypothetical protein